MDKVITMLVLVEHQHIVEGWLPLSQPSLGLPSESKEERLEDVYAELIQCTKRLMPLRSKEEPKVSMSTCIHPKKELRGGGNQAGSYIYCRLCHSRWENTMRSQEMRKEIKEQNAKKKGGLLSQETQAQQAPHTMKNAEEHSTASLVEGLRSAIQEEQAKTERMRSMMQKEMEAQRIASQEAQLRNERMIQSLLQSRQGPEVIPEEMAVVKCLCGGRGREVEGQKGRAKTRKVLLEMCPEEVRVLQVGQPDGRHQHHGKLQHSGQLRSISSSTQEEIQEPTEEHVRHSRRGSHHDPRLGLGEGNWCEATTTRAREMFQEDAARKHGPTLQSSKGVRSVEG